MLRNANRMTTHMQPPRATRHARDFGIARSNRSRLSQTHASSRINPARMLEKNIMQHQFTRRGGVLLSKRARLYFRHVDRRWILFGLTATLLAACAGGCVE